MTTDGCKTLWASKIIQHAWDILVNYNAPKMYTDTSTSDLLMSLEFCCGDDEWFEDVIGMSSLPSTDAKCLLEAALIRRYDELRLYLTERLRNYEVKLTTSTIDRPSRRRRAEVYGHKIADLELGLRWLERYRNQKLTPKQHDMLVRIYDMKGRRD